VRHLKTLSLLAALLGLLCAGIASADNGAKAKAKSYAFTVGSDTKVGTVVLTRGDYKVKLEGTDAMFTKDGTGKTFNTPAKLESGAEKFSRTSLHLVQDAGQGRIVAIELKGTQTLLKFD
jgi:uncharacterized membrane protein